MKELWIALVLGGLLLVGCVGPRGVGGLPRGVAVRELETAPPEKGGPRILCVVAHPDDEIAFAGTLYKTTTFLHGRADVLVVTNGEGGYKYSTLAERVYGAPLTTETVGRERLPAIRHGELAAGCRWLGVRTLYFLDERDEHYTRDEGEMLRAGARVWDLARVEASIRAVLARGHYDFVFVLAPTPETHGGHKAATILALRAVSALPEAQRPVILCGRGRGADEELAELAELPGYPLTRTLPGTGLRFDRTQKFGYAGRLDYHIVANWAIAEHKSQGTMQLLMNRGDVERYDLFACNAPGALGRARDLFAALAERQYPIVEPPSAP